MLKSEDKICRRCKRMFKYYGVGHFYCPSCAEVDRQIFEKVKTYLYEEGPRTMDEIAVATGVSIQQIELYLRQGRLEIPENSPIFIKCENCGVEMRSGRFCLTCANKLKGDWHGKYQYVEDEIGELRATAQIKMKTPKSKSSALRVEPRKAASKPSAKLGDNKEGK